jgi:hypothetical protein
MRAYRCYLYALALALATLAAALQGPLRTLHSHSHHSHGSISGISTSTRLMAGGVGEVEVQGRGDQGQGGQGQGGQGKQDRPPAREGGSGNSGGSGGQGRPYVGVPPPLDALVDVALERRAVVYEAVLGRDLGFDIVEGPKSAIVGVVMEGSKAAQLGILTGIYTHIHTYTHIYTHIYAIASHTLLWLTSLLPLTFILLYSFIHTPQATPW